jgi:hypothetical protein
MTGMKVKKLFFDRKAVMDAVSRTARKVLSKFGAFVRTAARSSIRKRKRTSRPGEPPSSHAGLLKKLIFFSYEPARQSVVIGPERLNQKIGDAPHALEHGGETEIASGWGARRRKRRITLAARPYMGPAFEKERPKLPAMWAESIR